MGTKSPFEHDLKALLDRVRSVVTTLPDVIWSVEVPSRQVLYASPAVEQIFGRQPEEFYADAGLWANALHPDDRARMLEHWHAGTQGASWTETYRIVRPDGNVRWVESHGKGVRDASGKVIRIDGISRDVTERHEQEIRIARLSRVHAVLSGISSAILRLRERDQLLQEACRIAAEQGGFGIVWIGALDHERGCIRAIAHRGVEARVPTEYALPDPESIDASAGTSFRVAFDGKPVYCNDIAAEPARNALRETALRLGYRSVISLPLTIAGKVEGVIAMFARDAGHFDEEEERLLVDLAGDISLALERIDAAEKLKFLAHYDEITGLPNRALLKQQLGALLDAARIDGNRTALAVVDVKRFRLVNETYGREVGDSLLRKLAQRLRALQPGPQCIARLAGDSFALVLPAVDDPQDIANAVERCLEAASAEPFEVAGHEIRIAMIAGVAVRPPDGDDVETLLRNAETAHKRAKRAPERVLFYHPEMNARVAETMALENRLRRAVAEKQFVLHYQPKVHAGSGRVTGLEALIRWRDPEAGLVSPGKFIPLLEETGLILEVGEWAIRRALVESRAWRRPNGVRPRIAVNVSQIQLRRRDFVDGIKHALEELGGEACPLDLEITESLVMENVDENVRKLAALRDIGVNVAIDDFGTGYSSLAYLARLPVNALKIDRSFVHTMGASSHSLTLVSTIISLAHALNLKVVAEGVETAEQDKLLRLLRCDKLQGFLFSRPVPAENVPALLERTFDASVKPDIETAG